jgi:hypothetical protein
MNEHDKSNLEFLLTADAAVIRDWAGKMQGDDIVYAQELLLQHAADLRERSREILVEAEMARLDNSYDLAGEYLRKFTLKNG